MHTPIDVFLSGVMRTNDTPLTPLRIRNGDRNTVRSVLGTVAGISALILGFTIVWDLLAKRLPLSEALVSLPGRTLLIVLFVGAISVLLFFSAGFRIRGKPYWIEVSDQLSYRNRRGLSHVDWVDVKSMHFEYSHIYESDDPLPHDAYNTWLIITLATDRRLQIQVGSVIPSAADRIDTIIQALARGFSVNQSTTRQAAVTALSRLGPVCLDNLRHVAKHGEHDCLREDAAEAIEKLQNAVRLLQTVTRNDDDESVRMAAAKAVDRIQLNSG